MVQPEITGRGGIVCIVDDGTSKGDLQASGVPIPAFDRGTGKGLFTPLDGLVLSRAVGVGQNPGVPWTRSY